MEDYINLTLRRWRVEIRHAFETERQRVETALMSYEEKMKEGRRQMRLLYSHLQGQWESKRLIQMPWRSGPKLEQAIKTDRTKARRYDSLSAERWAKKFLQKEIGNYPDLFFEILGGTIYVQIVDQQKELYEIKKLERDFDKVADFMVEFESQVSHLKENETYEMPMDEVAKMRIKYKASDIVLNETVS